MTRSVDSAVGFGVGLGDTVYRILQRFPALWSFHAGADDEAICASAVEEMTRNVSNQKKSNSADRMMELVVGQQEVVKQMKAKTSCLLQNQAQGIRAILVIPT